MNNNYNSHESLMSPDLIDSLELDALYSNEVSQLKFVDDDFYNLDTAISLLPKEEQDIFQLSFAGKTQCEISEILGLTQRTISYRLKRGAERIKYYLYLCNLDMDMVRDDLSDILNPQQLDAVIGTLTTTSQTTVAGLLGINQSMVRWRFFNALRVIKRASKQNPKYTPYIQVLDLAKGWFCIFKKNFVFD